MCIYCDYCVYHYKSTELVSLYTLDIGLKINIIIITSYKNTEIQLYKDGHNFAIFIMTNLRNATSPNKFDKTSTKC